MVFSWHHFPRIYKLLLPINRVIIYTRINFIKDHQTCILYLLFLLWTGPNAFIKECRLKACATCGAIPLTQPFLNNPAVPHEVSSTDDTPDVTYIATSASNLIGCMQHSMSWWFKLIIPVIFQSWALMEKYSVLMHQKDQTVDSTLVSAEEGFLSAEYKASNERWLKAAAQCDEFLKKKELENC